MITPRLLCAELRVRRFPMAEGTKGCPKEPVCAACRSTPYYVEYKIKYITHLWLELPVNPNKTTFLLFSKMIKRYFVPYILINTFISLLEVNEYLMNDEVEF